MDNYTQSTWYQYPAYVLGLKISNALSTMKNSTEDQSDPKYIRSLRYAKKICNHAGIYLQYLFPPINLYPLEREQKTDKRKIQPYHVHKGSWIS